MNEHIQERLFKCQEAAEALYVFKRTFPADSDEFSELHLMEGKLRQMQEKDWKMKCPKPRTMTGKSKGI